MICTSEYPDNISSVRFAVVAEQHTLFVVCDMIAAEVIGIQLGQ